MRRGRGNPVRGIDWSSAPGQSAEGDGCKIGVLLENHLLGGGAGFHGIARTDMHFGGARVCSAGSVGAFVEGVTNGAGNVFL